MVVESMVIEFLFFIFVCVLVLVVVFYPARAVSACHGAVSPVSAALILMGPLRCAASKYLTSGLLCLCLTWAACNIAGGTCRFISRMVSRPAQGNVFLTSLRHLGSWLPVG